MQNFGALGATPPNPVPPVAGGFAPRPPIASGGWGLRPQTPKHSPLNCEFLAMRLPRFALFRSMWGSVAFVLNNFFLIVQLQTL